MNASLLSADARAAVRDAVARVERHTAAEIVVAVRYRSASYRHTDYLVGFVLALAALCALLFLPQEFDIITWPLEVTLGFVAGAVVCAQLPGLKRLLTSRRAMNDEVARAARAAFVDLGVTRTRARSGVLVYVSMLERRAEVVPDTALDVLKKDEGWHAALQALDASVARGTFTKALEGLREPLARLLPRTEDDVNELADGVREP